MKDTLKVSDVLFREDLYPRIETSAITVQKYAEDLDVLPPIEVNQNKEIIDGWHRWTAHKKAKAETIRVSVTPTKSDGELLELAIERNATHGLQLSQADKEKLAGRLYSAFLAGKPRKDETAAYKEKLSKILSLLGEVPGLPDDCVTWVGFTPNGGLRGQTITVRQLIQILRFDLRPDTLERLSLRRHHKVSRVVELARAPLGFDYSRYITKRS